MNKQRDAAERPFEERGQWGHKVEYLLAVAGNIVGLGNVWRFPYLCYKNGGGAFLVPYLLLAVTCGIPLFLLETAMGQYTKEGSITCWRKLCPVAEGIGYAGLLILFYNMCYFIILAWALFYLYFSFSSQLPWASCSNTWNSDHCKDFSNLTTNWTQQLNKSSSAATEFWERRVLQISGGIAEVGSVRWEVLLCLFIVWVISYFCIWKGVKSTGKVVYFTATFPYLMLLVLIRGLTLPGALQGVVFYLYPDTSRLGDPQVWMDAGSQIFFSYSLRVGSLTVLGSYNAYNNNCYKDCLWLCLLNSGTSMVAGFAVFSVLGFMAHELGTAIEEVAESAHSGCHNAHSKPLTDEDLAEMTMPPSEDEGEEEEEDTSVDKDKEDGLTLDRLATMLLRGYKISLVLQWMSSRPGLAFIAYPQAVAMMPLPQMWACCFFIMLILLGLDTQFMGMEVMITSVTDLFPTVLRRAGCREVFLLFVCFTCFILQLVLVTEGGMYVLQLLDYYACSGICLFLLSVLKVLAMGWLFGAERLMVVIEDMTGERPNLIFKLCWLYFTPLVTLGSFIYSLVEYQPLTFNRWYVYPHWAYVLGWLLALSSIVLVPVWGLVKLSLSTGTLRQRWSHLCRPDNLPLTRKQMVERDRAISTTEMEDLMTIQK